MVRGISEGKGVGFRLGLRRMEAKCWGRSLCGMVGEVAGGLGEIGGRILGCSGGVLGAGSLGKGEAEVGCFWVDFREEPVTLSLGIALWNRLPSLRVNSYSSPLLFS